MSKKPITRKIVRSPDSKHTAWVLYVEEYERAVKAMGDAIYAETCAVAAYRSARRALKAIGIVPPKGKT